MRDLLNVKAKCDTDGCDWKGRVRLAKKCRPGRHSAITGVPCPECGGHHLKRKVSSRKPEPIKESK